MQSQAAARQPHVLIRPIRPQDNAVVGAIVRQVLGSFGRSGPGTVLEDSELDCMFETYSMPRSAYFVVEQDGVIVGGAGISPLKGGDGVTCELQKTYLLPESQGQGLGRRMIALCLEEAVRLGFTLCYLETYAHMDVAQAVYRSFGFRQLTSRLGATGHHQGDRWYAKEL